MKKRVSELEGAELDYWVAKSGEEWKTAHKLFPTMTLDPTFSRVAVIRGRCVLIPNNPFRQDPKDYSPSSLWEHGGPIIARERIMIAPFLQPGSPGACWRASKEYYGYNGDGPTPLIAAMRAYVASKYGDEVDAEK